MLPRVDHVHSTLIEEFSNGGEEYDNHIYYFRFAEGATDGTMYLVRNGKVILKVNLFHN